MRPLSQTWTNKFETVGFLEKYSFSKLTTEKYFKQPSFYIRNSILSKSYPQVVTWPMWCFKHQGISVLFKTALVNRSGGNSFYALRLPINFSVCSQLCFYPSVISSVIQGLGPHKPQFPDTHAKWSLVRFCKWDALVENLMEFCRNGEDFIFLFFMVFPDARTVAVTIVFKVVSGRYSCKQ